MATSASSNQPNTHWQDVSKAFNQYVSNPEGKRPNYLWGVLHAASIAHRTGVEAISVIECGVAGGNGLLALELSAGAAKEVFGIDVQVFGFDTGEGLPPTDDVRDAPFLMEPGDFPMDVQQLRARLSNAQLILGLCEQTVPEFFKADHPPIAFISFDLDYYTSTRDALALLKGPTEAIFPRVLCYMDDIHGYPWGQHNGALLAVREFNEEPHGRKLDRIEWLKYLLPRSQYELRWVEAMYLGNIFDHPRYNEPEGTGLVSRLDLES